MFWAKSLPGIIYSNKGLAWKSMMKKMLNFSEHKSIWVSCFVLGIWQEVKGRENFFWKIGKFEFVAPSEELFHT